MSERRRYRVVIMPAMDERYWSLRIKFGYDPELSNWMKQFPGGYWDAPNKQWKFPMDLVPELKQKAKELGYTDFYERAGFEPVPPTDVMPNPTSVSGYNLFEFQGEDFARIVRLLADLGAVTVLWEMGLGKAILAALLASPGTIIVCPRQGVGPIKDEMAEWRPDMPVHEIKPTAKKRWLVKPDHVNVISFGLVERAVAELDWHKTERMIVDEVHAWKTDNTHQTQAGRALIKATKPDTIVGMTGTLVSNKVNSMLNPLDILFPGRYTDHGGNPNHFYFRHMNSTPNNYGSTFYGVREDTLGELKRRLELTGVRRTKEEVAHLLPPFTGPVAVEAHGDRLKAAKELALETLGQGVSHVTIHTYRRQSAKDVHAMVVRALGPKWKGDSAVIDGSVAAEKRDEIRKRLMKAPVALLVTTISSMKLAIDLSRFDVAIYAELTENMEELLQSLGRYPRLAKTATPTHVLFIYERGESLARRMAAKVKVYQKIQGADFGSEKALAALDEIADSYKLNKSELDELIALAVSKKGVDFDSQDWKEE